MYGRPLRRKKKLTRWRLGRVQSCIRPVDAAQLTAGPDEVRGPAPHHRSAL
jgi:hypothetical protein